MKNALVIFILLTTACSKQSTGTTTPGGAGRGTLAGTVELIGGVPCADSEEKCADRSGYEVIVYKLDGKTVAGSAKTTADGKFTLDLPAGKYVILTPKGAMPGENRIEVSVSRDALSNIDLRIDNGVRASSQL